MGFLQLNLTSEILGKMIAVNAAVPQESLKNSGDYPHYCGRKYPVLYLLHGLSDDYSAWMRRTSIERYADRYRIVVIMPDGGRSFYTDAVQGFKYFTFLAEELPCLLNNMLPISMKKEETFAAGLSMGGYGALKLGLRHPDRFAGIGALSAVTDIIGRWLDPALDVDGEFARIFGSAKETVDRGNDLFSLAENAVNSGIGLPKIISICGLDDFMVEDNRRFNARMKKIDYPEFHDYFRPGVHNWEFWDDHIQDILKYFFENRLPDMV